MPYDKEVQEGSPSLFIMEKTKVYSRGTESVKLTIQIKQGGLSICGNYQNNLYGKKAGETSGQCHEECKEFIPVELYDIWLDWHLNDMQAGTPAQTKALKEKFGRSGFNYPDYTEQCKYLESIGLLVDGEYKYGTKWLGQELPQSVVTYLENL